jgi:ABC-type Zn2+ transport system substrate-binding protein/surface adhesin
MRLFDTLSPTRRLYFTAICRELPKCPQLGSQHNQFLHDISHRLIPLRRRPVHLWTFILKVQPLPFRFSKERKDDFHDVDDSASEEEYYENDHDEESDEDTSYDATRNKNVQYHLCLRP